MPLALLERLKRFAMADGGSVTARVIRSGFWVGLSESLATLLGVLRSVLLARLLSPETFGLMGVASIAIRTIETFTRPGVTQALLAKQEEVGRIAPTAYTLLVLRGLLLSALLALAAPFIARFYDQADLQPVLQALSVVFLIGGLSNIALVVDQKNIEFRRIAYINQLANVAGTVLTLLLAYFSRSVWALVAGQIATASLTTLFSYWMMPARIRFGFDATVAKDLLSYGRFITGSSILLFLATEIDSAVVGKTLGMEQLGYYAMAFTLANIVTTNVSRVASGIMLPAYSGLQSDKRALQQAYVRTISFIMLIVLPAAVGTVIVADLLVAVVLGNRWQSVAMPLQLLCCFGVFRSLASFSGYLFEGIGKPHIAFYTGIPRLCLILVGIVPAVSRFGLAGAALLVTAAMAVQCALSLIWLKRVIGLRHLDLLKGVWRPVWSTAIMAAGVLVVLRAASISPWVNLSLAVGVGVVLYLLVNLRYISQTLTAR